MLPSTPVKESQSPIVPRMPVKMRAGPKTPTKKGSPSIFGDGSAVAAQQRRRAPPPRLDLGGLMSKKKNKVMEEEGVVGLLNSPILLMANAPAEAVMMFPQTPVKQRIPCTLPRTPQKKNKRSSVNRDDVMCGSSSHLDCRVSRFFIPTADIASSDACSKETDSCSCKRKRSE